MKTPNLLSINDFCIHHKADIRFIMSLQYSGLIKIISVEENYFIDSDQLVQLEKFTRLFYEMDINIEGIETISYLLQRLNNMHEEINALRNHLRFYELVQ